MPYVLRHACISAVDNLNPVRGRYSRNHSSTRRSYATLLFNGSYSELEKLYNWLFGEWLPKSGYEAGNFPKVLAWADKLQTIDAVKNTTSNSFDNIYEQFILRRGGAGYLVYRLNEGNRSTYPLKSNISALKNDKFKGIERLRMDNGTRSKISLTGGFLLPPTHKTNLSCSPLCHKYLNNILMP